LALFRVKVKAECEHAEVRELSIHQASSGPGGVIVIIDRKPTLHNLRMLLDEEARSEDAGDCIIADTCRLMKKKKKKKLMLEC
jgi:hypothetical protein